MSGTGSGAGVTIGSCDVLVAGGGPAGCAAALALVRAGVDVVIVAPVATADWQVGESCAPAARPLLERLGLLDLVALDGHAPCYGIQAAWGGDAPTEVSQVLGPYGAGWHLDRARFDAAFLEVAEAAGASRHAGRVRCIWRREDHWQLTTDAGGLLRARYLVDATGRPARLARRLGATPSRSDRLTAVAGLLAAPGGAAGSEHTSLVESTPWGWWYTAPLPGGTQVLMAMTDADLVVGTHLLDRDAWWAQAQRTGHIRHRIAHLDAPPRQLRVLAAGSSHTRPAAGPGWTVAGDAASATDPLAARGIVMALATGLDSARAILADHSGDTHALAAYARRIAALHQEYLRAQAAQYRRERRWDAAPFWRRRHQASFPALISA
ncbi:NAD(P)/FAD-dependent oxidoreductase [Streptomyces sp. NPDC054849]